MKILHITLYPEAGTKHTGVSGVASYSKNLIESLNRKDHNHFVLCNKTSKEPSKREDSGIAVIRAFERNPFFFFQTLKWVFKINPDVVHMQHEVRLFGPLWMAYFLPLLLLLIRIKSKVVVTLHGVVSLENVKKDFIADNYNDTPVSLVKAGFFFLYFPLGLVVNKLIVHEEHFKKVLQKNYLVSKEKIKVVPHGIEILEAEIKQAALDYLNLDRSKKIILFAGYYSGYKNLELLIEAFAQYCKQNPRAFLLIASGKHPKFSENTFYKQNYENLKSKASDLISSKNYRWDGFISEEDFTYYFGAADLLVFPYNIAMASSGIMSLALAYKVPFLVSRPFEFLFENKENVFDLQTESLVQSFQTFFKEEKNLYPDDLKKLRESRLWDSVGKKTYMIYEELVL